MKLKIVQQINEFDIQILSKQHNQLSDYIDENQVAFVNEKFDQKAELVHLDLMRRHIVIVDKISKNSVHAQVEQYRKIGAQIFKLSNTSKLDQVALSDNGFEATAFLAIIEGFLLSAYTFDKYFTDKSREKIFIKNIKVQTTIEADTFKELKNVCDAVISARNLVNEPLSYLSAEQLGEEVIEASAAYGFKADVLGKKQIEALKFGGLLAVNKGSFDPPSFSILEWKPKKHRNKQPIILVGKGVVFDTGGLSLKPTAGSMDEMKSDMAGAAAVLGAFQAIAANQLDLYVIGLIPATDNRPGNKAYAPQDVIVMHDGTKVEVLNTDAEGRMILADALSYAKRYKPELVINLATLTGSAHAAIGPYGIVSMGNAEQDVMSKLKQSGENVYERLVEFPFWEEYGELNKSDVADIKNVGGKYGGAITAGKFLEHFTDYPFIHLDIAGVAFLPSKDAYRPKGGSGIGVRLLYDFLKNY